MTQPRPVSHRRPVPLAVLVALAVTAAGCSSSGSGAEVTTAEPAEAPTTTTAAAPTTQTTAVPSTAAPAGPPPAPAPPASPAEPATGALPPPAVVAAPTDPEELGRMVDELVAAETSLRDPATPDDQLAELARRQQAIYRSLSARPAALDESRHRIPEPLLDIIEANVTAGAELVAMTTPRTELPDWQIVAPPPAAELWGYYREAQERYGVGWEFLAAVHLVETRMGRIRGTSTAGARGPMQFMPATWERWGEGDIEDARDSILAAGRYLQSSGAPGDMDRALFAYNRSQRYVRAVTAYARQMQVDPRAYLAYYHWQVYYRTPGGDVLLAEGYGH